MAKFQIEIEAGEYIAPNKNLFSGLHDLRHSMVALLMEEDNVNLPAIQKRARHSSSKITSDIYGHISKKRATQTASQFDKYAPNKNFVNKSSTT